MMGLQETLRPIIYRWAFFISKIEGDIVMKKKGKVEQEGSDISLRREKVFGEDVSRLFNGYDRRSINIIIV